MLWHYPIYSIPKVAAEAVANFISGQLDISAVTTRLKLG
jgi:hypothetical protein